MRSMTYGKPDERTLEQYNSALALDCVVQGALMPDAHVGYSLPIGAVIATQGMIFPSWVGYDIGCGVLAAKLDVSVWYVREHASEIRAQILERVPVGFAHRQHPLEWDNIPACTDACETIINAPGNKGYLHQLGTLGGGNHFIEIGADEDDQVWVIIHSGSRGIGHAVATHYMKLASGDGKAREGHYGFVADDPYGLDYMMDQQFCLKFALQNRYQMLYAIIKVLYTSVTPNRNHDDIINRNHNHVEEHLLDDCARVYIHRKGATHAEEGMMGVIPGNMRDGSYIVRGKGNPDSLWSSSHGAGRAMSRKQAKETLSRHTFERGMRAARIETGNLDGLLDEAPDAYKDIGEVMSAQSDLVDIVTHVSPIINVKGN